MPGVSRTQTGRLFYLLAGLLILGFVFAPSASAQLKKGKIFKSQKKTCLDCHGKEARDFKKRSSVHAPVASDSCESCHRRHGVVGLLRLTADDPELCFTCHAQPGSPASETPRPPAGRKGKGAKAPPEMSHPPGEDLKCGSCHDPHGSDGEHLLRAREPDMCLSCHAEEEHQGTSSHAAAQVGCLTCHDPHGRGESGGLRTSVDGLCAGCHDGSSGGEKRGHGGGVPGPGTCLTCHTPHASENDGLLLPRVHGALAEGGESCATCHQAGDGGEATWALNAEAGELCMNCHEDPAQAPDGERVHGALAAGDCLTCHSPHASRESALLKGTQGEVCGVCHVEAEAAATATHPHGPAAGDCTGCHQPHTGGDNLLTATSPDLCLTCHDGISTETARATAHPPAADDCLTCHDPHGTEHPGILKASQGDLCATCHDSMAEHLEARVPHAPVVSGDCMGCHEPHGSDGDHLVVADLSKACLGCHQATATTISGEGRHAPYQEGECLSCHSPHSSTRVGLLVEESLLLCRTCHEESQEDKEAWSRHMPVKRGQCLSCHGPHGGHEPGLMRRGDGRTMCLSCHADQGQSMSRKDGTVHEPFQDGSCLTCHEPHASNHVPLLVDATGPLCSSCHDIAERKMTQAHKGLVREESDCAGCHEPHASDGKKLMLAGQHAPFADGECGSCHGGGARP